MNNNVITGADDELPERRRKPFVPDPDRVIYPVDLAASQQAAREKFEAEVRIMVGGQLTRRLIDQACDLEDDIRSRSHDAAHYAQLEVALQTFMADAIHVRHQYMNPDDERRGW